MGMMALIDQYNILRLMKNRSMDRLPQIYSEARRAIKDMLSLSNPDSLASFVSEDPDDWFEWLQQRSHTNNSIKVEEDSLESREKKAKNTRKMNALNFMHVIHLDEDDEAEQIDRPQNPLTSQQNNSAFEAGRIEISSSENVEPGSKQEEQQPPCQQTEEDYHEQQPSDAQLNCPETSIINALDEDMRSQALSRLDHSVVTLLQPQRLQNFQEDPSIDLPHHPLTTHQQAAPSQQDAPIETAPIPKTVQANKHITIDLTSEIDSQITVPHYISPQVIRKLESSPHPHIQPKQSAFVKIQPTSTLNYLEPSSPLHSDNRFVKSYKSRLNRKMKQAKREMGSTLQIVTKRTVERGNALFEYMWRFWGVSCWNTLIECDTLYQLYLCQARKERSAITHCLNGSPIDLNTLIFKIESRPTCHYQQEEIERMICDSIFSADLAKSFQLQMMKKVLLFNLQEEAKNIPSKPPRHDEKMVWLKYAPKDVKQEHYAHQKH